MPYFVAMLIKMSNSKSLQVLFMDIFVTTLSQSMLISFASPLYYLYKGLSYFFLSKS